MSAPVVEEVPVHEGGGHGCVILQIVMPFCLTTEKKRGNSQLCDLLSC